MGSKFIYIFLFIFLISLGSAVTLTMSPPQINFIGKTNELICQEVNLEVEGIETLIGKTRWAEEGFNERDLLKHKLGNEDLKIEVNFPKEIEISERKEIKICVESSKGGNYHGVLLYKIQDKPIQVGIWMNVSLIGNDLLKITGNFVKIKGEGNIGFYFTAGLFLVFLSVLGWYWKRK